MRKTIMALTAASMTSPALVAAPTAADARHRYRSTAYSNTYCHRRSGTTGTMQRRSTLPSADRQKGLSRLRTLVTGLPLAAAGPGKPHVIASIVNAPPSLRRSTGAALPG